jgi:GT2 family glycosyltransferase
VGFYNAAMIAAEDTEMSMRLGKHGWRMRRIDAEMTLHDAAMTRFGQWWNRTRRSGHGFGELAFLHPDARNPNWSRTVRSVFALLALVLNSRWWIAAALLVLPWPLRMAQLARRQRRRGLSPPVARASGILLMLGKFPQFLGLIGYHRDRLTGHASRLIEYKGAETS